ncbi:hypothetical protein CSPHI_01930 [Corynebacterium sphenisci DSM 44792]|uniref:Uncharacterized protein n=1 Tax=Corynebacterium sphenisci DSM 44792 TaxID=1437874 RepID=A0A1L7CW18_9CORY|nr:hypothetical protein [Corynebacterium sphenisci]APT90043.1 hypothetical protein CSPHI_01930 [Corynebacterium sphenisci DSM 44792]
MTAPTPRTGRLRRGAAALAAGGMLAAGLVGCSPSMLADLAEELDDGGPAPGYTTPTVAEHTWSLEDDLATLDDYRSSTPEPSTSTTTSTTTATTTATITAEPEYAPAEQWPSAPYAAPAGYQWTTEGPYGTGTSTNCEQIAYSDHTGGAAEDYTGCFEMSDGWHYYALRRLG